MFMQWGSVDWRKDPLLLAWYEQTKRNNLTKKENKKEWLKNTAIILTHSIETLATAHYVLALKIAVVGLQENVEIDRNKGMQKWIVVDVGKKLLKNLIITLLKNQSVKIVL